MIFVDDYPHNTFVGYCSRCRTPLQDEEGAARNYAGGLCQECIDEAWSKAVSRGGSDNDVELRAAAYMATWRESAGRGIL